MSQKCRTNLRILAFIGGYLFYNSLSLIQVIVFTLPVMVLIIAWSLVQVQQGPPNFKDLREIAGPFCYWKYMQLLAKPIIGWL